MPPSTSSPEADTTGALTGALVDANDRLLGLIRLTEVATDSLEEDARCDAIAGRARSLLALDGMRVAAAGAPVRVWGRPQEPDDSGWSQVRPLGGDDAVVIRAWRGTPFDTGDTKLLDAVANVIADGIRTARLHAEAVRAALVASEHATASRLTSATLADPSALPDVAGVDIAVHFTPARTTGGDLWLVRRVAGALWLAAGDISGKGLPAAVLMTTVITGLRAAIDNHHQDGTLAVMEATAGTVHSPLSNAGLFCTLAVARWSDNQLDVANAGHSPVVRVRNGAANRISATAPPLGVLADALPTAETFDTRPGDLLVLATDGCSEQRGMDGEPFGEDEFDQAVAQAAVPGDRSPMDKLTAVLDDHQGSAVQDDDRTIVMAGFS